jgi:pseudaminic acid cytidylyltransferase
MDRKVAIIPARGGSKRIPRKNIRSFHGKPLIAYSIETALQSGLFDRIIVSTDDQEIAEIARAWGAETPFTRPSELADDHTSTNDVIDHAIGYLERDGEHFDYVCTIYATAPFLKSEFLVKGYDALRTSDAVYAFSATSMPFPIQRTFKLTPEGRCKMFFPQYYFVRSQDLEEAYQDAGQFYWRHLHRTSDDTMFGKDSIPIILPRYLVHDIDTPEDWEYAEIQYKILQEYGKL